MSVFEAHYNLSLDISAASRITYADTTVGSTIPLSIRNERGDQIDGGVLRLNVDGPEEVTVSYTNTGEKLPIDFPHPRTTMHGNSVQQQVLRIQKSNPTRTETLTQELRFYLETKSGEVIDEQVVTVRG